jgi:DNA repair protein SbcC/Rad50
MILRSIRVRNIRSHTETTVNFGPGTTLLAGDVGSGKTSLLYAVEMALFGFAEVDPAHLVRHRAREAEVALTLEDGEHWYEFRRRFRRRTVRGKETFEVEENSYAEDGARTKYSTTELRSRSIELLGFPDNPNPRAHSDVWRWAIYIPQERMRDILLQEPTARLETVRKALGLEHYHLAAENAAEVATELRRVAEARESEADLLRHHSDDLPRWSALHTTWERERQALDDELAGRRAERERADAALAAIERERAGRAAEEKGLARRREELASGRQDLETRHTRFGQLVAEVESLEREREPGRRALESLRARTPELASSRARAKEVEEALGRIETALREQARWQSTQSAEARAVREAEGALEVHARQRTVLAEDLARAEAERPLKEPAAPTPRELPEIAEHIARLRAENDRDIARLAAAEHDRKDLEQLVDAGTCPRCHQSVARDQFEGHLDEARASAASIEKLLADRRADLEQQETEQGSRERYERARDRFREVEARRQMLRDQVIRHDATRPELESRRDEHRARVEEARTSLQAIGPRVAEHAEREAERAQLRRIIEEGESIAAEIARLEQKSRDRDDRIARDRGSIEREGQELAALRNRVEATERELSALADRLRASPDLGRTFQDLRSDAERARGELERVLQRLSRVSADVQNAQERIREAETGARLRSEKVSEGLHLRLLAGWLGREFREGLFDLEHRRLARAQAEFNRAFARYFQTLLEDPNLVARCDAAFSPSVEIDGDTTPAEALSGGERTALALAFRLAMGQVVRAAGRLRLGTLILDEPTDGFSPEQVSRMGELLAELEIPQVILVSHEGQLAGIADHVVQVSKDEGPSVVRPSVPSGATEPEVGTPAPRSRRRASERPLPPSPIDAP